MEKGGAPNETTAGTCWRACAREVPGPGKCGDTPVGLVGVGPALPRRGSWRWSRRRCSVALQTTTSDPV